MTWVRGVLSEKKGSAEVAIAEALFCPSKNELEESLSYWIDWLSRIWALLMVVV